MFFFARYTVIIELTMGTIFHITSFAAVSESIIAILTYITFSSIIPTTFTIFKFAITHNTVHSIFCPESVVRASLAIGV